MLTNNLFNNQLMCVLAARCYLFNYGPISVIMACCSVYSRVILMAQCGKTLRIPGPPQWTLIWRGKRVS